MRSVVNECAVAGEDGVDARAPTDSDAGSPCDVVALDTCERLLGNAWHVTSMRARR